MSAERQTSGKGRDSRQSIFLLVSILIAAAITAAFIITWLVLSTAGGVLKLPSTVPIWLFWVTVGALLFSAFVLGLAFMLSVEHFRKFLSNFAFEETAFWVGFLSAFVGVIASIALLAHPTAAGEEKLSTAWLGGGLLALSVFLLTHLIHNKLSLRQFRKEIQRELDHVKQNINIKDMQYFADEDKAINHIIGRLHKAKKVHNTHIRFGDEEQHDKHLYPENSEKFVEEIRRFCRGGGSWIDVVSQNGITRANKILNINQDESNTKNEINYDGRESIHAKYALYILDGTIDIPMTNIIIITMDDEKNTREVYFGWGINDRAANTNVFGSREPSIVNYFFEQYYELLRSHSSVRIKKDEYESLLSQSGDDTFAKSIKEKRRERFKDECIDIFVEGHESDADGGAVNGKVGQPAG